MEKLNILTPLSLNKRQSEITPPPLRKCSLDDQETYPGALSAERHLSLSSDGKYSSLSSHGKNIEKV